MSSPVAPLLPENSPWIIIFDDSCPVVQRLGWLVRQWDKRNIFRFVGRDTTDNDSLPLAKLLDETPWSLLLVDDEGNTWAGPEAIPFILKNLPSGRLAAVAYTLPGTMWLTRQLYYLVSRNRRLFSPQTVSRLQTAGTSTKAS